MEEYDWVEPDEDSTAFEVGSTSPMPRKNLVGDDVSKEEDKDEGKQDAEAKAEEEAPEYSEAYFASLGQDMNGNHSNHSTAKNSNGEDISLSPQRESHPYSYSASDLGHMTEEFGKSLLIDSNGMGISSPKPPSKQREPRNNNGISSIPEVSNSSTAATMNAAYTLLQTNYIPFYGRQDELALLQKAVERISLEWMENPSEVVWVSGKAGVGKTTLVKQASESSNGGGAFWKAFCCKGSCEEHSQASRPFKALGDCLNDLVLNLLDQGGGKQVWKSRLEEALGGEGSLLSTICPKLIGILDCPPMDRRLLMMFDANLPRRTERLAFAVRDLLQAVSEYHPLVMVVDNIHWADPDSLKLWQDLLTTKTLQNFLLVGIHDPLPALTTSDDSESKSEIHPLAQLKQALVKHAEEKVAQEGHGSSGAAEKITELRLQPFPLEQVEEMMCSIFLEEGDLEQDDIVDNIQDLSELVHALTKGNTLWMLQLLRLWNDKKLLTYKEEENRWEWNRKKLKKEAKSWKEQGLPCFDSLQGVVQTRLEALPKKVRFATEILATLGLTTFHIDHLLRVANAAYQKQHKSDTEPIATQEIFEKMVVRGVHFGIFKKMTRQGAYKFSHDVVRQVAATTFTPTTASKRSSATKANGESADAKAMTHFRIGTELSAMCMDQRGEERERFKFLAVQQLNHCLEIMNDDEKARVAKLNFEAAEIAIAKTAFRTAVQFLEHGVAALEHHIRWQKKYYDITLRTFLFLARMRMCCGRIPAAKAACDEILENGATLKDRVYANQVLMIIMVGEGKHDQAMVRLLSILKQLGESFPNGDDVGSVIEREINSLRKSISQRNNQQLLNPPKMTDKKCMDIMMLLCNLVEISRNASPNRYVELATIRMMHVSLRHGFTRQYPMAFSLFGVCLMKRGYLKEAHRMGQVTEKIARISDFYGGEAVALFHWHISHWRRRYRRNLEPVLQIYNAQVDMGDFHHVDFSISTYIQYHLASGFDLGKLSDNLQLFDSLYNDYRLKNDWHIVIPQQLVANLVGETHDPLLFFGDTITQQEIKIEEYEAARNFAAVDYILFLRMFAAFFFHDFEVMEECLDKMDRPVEGVWIPWMTFFEAYIQIQYLPTTKGKRRKELKEEIEGLQNKMIDWYNDGAPNTNAMTSILEAEWTIAKEAGKGLSAMKAQELFNEAIAAAKAEGAVHLEAFAAERAGLHFDTTGVEGFCAEFMVHSHKAYDRCHYVAKVIDLENKFASKLKISKRRARPASAYIQQNATLKPSDREIGGGAQEIKSVNVRQVMKKVGKGVKNIRKGGVKKTSRKVKDMFKKEKAEPAPWGWNSNSQMVFEDESGVLMSPSRAPKPRAASLMSPSGNQFRENAASPNSGKAKKSGKQKRKVFGRLFRKSKAPLNDEAAGDDMLQQDHDEEIVEEATEAIDDMLESPKPRASRVLDIGIEAPNLNEDASEASNEGEDVERPRSAKKKKKKKKKKDRDVDDNDS